ncbi:maleylpyruvate isomerase family mycothiol-dependent enzyme [Glutamicibacter sp.]|uniref:maleylpyruvate isomerase family mycothiol-dependent enzyme n=1 Tax=Glutamicibacter sp. TaxID=1931995 RepID=UPI002FE29A33
MLTEKMWDVIVEERLKLCNILRELSPQQWSTPSLCQGWSVQDVAAHLISAPQLDARAMLKLMPSMIIHGYNGMTLRDGQQRGRAGAKAILQQYEQFATCRRGPALVNVKETLTDTLVHFQDLARPLGIKHKMPQEAAVEVAHRLEGTGMMLGSYKVNRAVKMIASDTDFESGKGDPLIGPIDELVMLRAGRSPQWELFEGSGVGVVQTLLTRREAKKSS